MHSTERLHTLVRVSKAGVSQVRTELHKCCSAYVAAVNVYSVLPRFTRCTCS